MNNWIHSTDTELGRWQNLISTLSNSDTFCVLPWIHFATRPNGDMRLCCSANASGAGIDPTIGLVKNDNGIPANFGRDTPLSAWNNQYMRNTRLDMLNGRIPPSCTKCFKEERNGVSSKRVWESHTWINEGIDIPELIRQTSDEGIIPENLVYLDLRLGNTCNLKCVMCSPHDSSKWVTENKKVYPTYQNEELKNQLFWDRKSFNNKWHTNPLFWEELYQQIPNLRQVYFAGGEPLMIEEHKRFIEEILRQGCQDNILLRYNSNGLLIDDDIIKLWSEFKKVKFGFSLDGTNDRNHYIRYPSDWATIENNLHLLDNTPDNIEVSIATAIQILNIKHIPDFIKWKVRSKFKKINQAHSLSGTQYGGGLINMHLLYMPTWLSCTVLPEIDKQEVIENFMYLRDWLQINYTRSNEFWENNPYGWRRYESLLKFMSQEKKDHLLPAFKEYIEKLDKHRNIKFSKIFPELSHLIL